MTKNKKNIVPVVLLIIGLILTITGVTYSLISYKGDGKEISSITTNGITFNYKEGNRSINLSNSLGISDSEGKVQNEYFEFELNGKTINGADIPYFITARKTNDSSDIGDAIKLYLTKVDKNGNETEVILSTFDDLDKYTNPTIDVSKYNERILYNDILEEGKVLSQKYRLRMWIDEDIDLTNSKYLDASFGLTVNVYTNGSIDTKNSGKVIATNANDLVRDMKAGYNLGNALDAHKKSLGHTYNTETIWDNPLTTQETIDTIKSMGFTSLRIPVTFYNHMDENGVIDTEWLNRIEEVVNYAFNDDMYVIINVHHDVGTWIYADVDTYDTDLANIKNLWQQIATYFKDYDNRLIYELQNEIINTDNNWDWGTEWNDFRVVHDMDQELITLIRSLGGHNDSRYLFVSSFGASTDSCEIEQLFYKAFTDTIEDHLLLSVHNYITDSSKVESLLSRLAGYATTYNMPVVITETGTMNTVNYETRVEVMSTLAEKAVEYNIGLYWWDDGAKYGLFERKTNHISYPLVAEAFVSKYN